MTWKITAVFTIISLNAILAVGQECQNGDKLPLYAECEWYRLCFNGKYVSRRCPTNNLGIRQAFDPQANTCSDNVKVTVQDKCHSFKQCLAVSSLSPFGKWTELSCESGKHFDPMSQQCIDASNSNCESKVCSENTCLNGGDCKHTGNDTFRCVCPIGFTGPNCQYENNPCSSDICLNGGVCFFDQLLQNTQCSCQEGFNGNKCEIDGNYSDEADCDFETDFCGYVPDSNFERHTGKAPSVSLLGFSSGPDCDHTTGLGYYALCVGHRLKSDDDTCTLSKTFTNRKRGVRFTFWYYLYGSSVGSLELLKDGEVTWSDNVRKNAWKKATVEFPVGTFTLTFVGRKQTGSATSLSSNIAIDDIALEINTDFRLSKKLQGHTGSVYSVAFNDANTIVASGSADSTIKLWNATTGDVLRTLGGHTDWVNSVAFSTNGNVLASGSYDGSVKLWNASSGDLVQILLGHSDRVWSVVFDQEDSILASGAADASIKLWNVNIGVCLRTLRGHVGWIRSVAFGGNGLLASGAQDSTIMLWDVSTGDLVRTLTDHDDWVYSVAFSSGGGLLASGSLDRTVRLWNPYSGDLLRTLRGHSSLVYSVVFRGDGSVLASGSGDASIKLWDVNTGNCVRTLKGHTEAVRAVAFGGDNALASASEDSTVNLWAL